MDQDRRDGLARAILISLAIFLGAVEFFGGLVVASGAASGGYSPLAGPGDWAAWAMIFLFSGPLALLPASLVALRSPRVGGALLLIAAVVSAIAAAKLMTTPPEAWSGGPGRLAHAFRWSLALILPVSAPMLFLGAFLIWDSGGQSTTGGTTRSSPTRSP
ncbi:hypothetical protein [Tautonia plasticadhaerens]|uniref:Uncharacterized protein n=1 Tax=Tautonia plasticadhaerens TaxID=2527974 RepID=A0A518H7L3_9BACT|nr:hypothetical protein [Tautonia plasticadhaerens]QDV36858.1 hypothetical protein ElP_47870 [Tautonia plasticadhaerens]